jgi:plastocyanin
VLTHALRALAIPTLFLAAAGCGSSSSTGGGATPATIPSGASVIHAVADATGTSGKFNPDPATAKVGQAVAWSFEDANNQHTATADDGSFDSGTESQGAVFTHTFTAAGTFKYHCTLHADMKGTLTVSQ